MTDVEPFGRLLLIAGVVIALVGGALLLSARVPFLSRLPGDLRFDWGGAHICVPLATSLLVSVLLTLALSLLT